LRNRKLLGRAGPLEQQSAMMGRRRVEGLKAHILLLILSHQCIEWKIDAGLFVFDTMNSPKPVIMIDGLRKAPALAPATQMLTPRNPSAVNQLNASLS
jgi:hypothetical protein